MEGKSQTSAPDIRLKGPSVDVIQSRLLETHEAFRNPSVQYDPVLQRYVPIAVQDGPIRFGLEGGSDGGESASRRPFPGLAAMGFWDLIFDDALARLKSQYPEPRGRLESAYSIRDAKSWVDVYTKLQLARESYDGAKKGFWGCVKRTTRQVDDASPVRAAVEVLLEAVKIMFEVRKQVIISSVYQNLDQNFGDVELFLATFPDDENIKKASVELVVAILKATEDTIRFFIRRQISRGVSAVLNAQTYQEALLNSIDRVCTSSNKLICEARKSFIWVTREAVRAVLDNMRPILPTIESQRQPPLLHIAAEAGSVDDVEALRDAGASMNARDRDGWTPLSIASQRGHTHIVQVLLSAGADVYKKNGDGRTPLSFAAQGGHRDVVQALLDAHTDVNARDGDGRTPLFLAVENSNKDVVEALLGAGADIHATGNKGETALHLATVSGNGQAVEVLLAAGADVDARDEDGKTALHLATERGFKEVVEKLLGFDADPTIVSADGETPESLARRGDASISHLLDQPPPQREKPRSTEPQILKPKEPDLGRQEICKHFQGLVWSPTTGVAKQQVWDLIYNDITREESLQKLAKSRWIHIPFNNDLVKGILSNDFANKLSTGQQIFEKVVDLIERHFTQSGATATKVEVENVEASGLKLLSLVMPTLDVDFENGTKEELRKIAQEDPSQASDSVEDNKTLLQHILLMEKMKASYTKGKVCLHHPHSLYSSTGYSSEESLNHRITNQVLCLHLKRPETSEAGSAIQQSIPITAIDQYTSAYRNDRLSWANDGLSEVRRSSEQHRDYRSEPNRRNSTTQRNRQQNWKTTPSPQHGAGKLMLRGIVIPQIWILAILIENDWTIITAFPERWDINIERTLPNTIRSAMLNARLRSPDTKVEDVVRQIMISCVNFVEETFHLSKTTPITYHSLFATSIAKLSDDLVDRYKKIKNKGSRIVKKELIEEVENLKMVDDIIYEIDIIKRVLNEQEHIIDQFDKSIVSLGLASQIGPNLYVHPAYKMFDRLEVEARRVRESLITLLDLKQRFATIEDARITANQTTILVIFTIATVTFSPLLLAVAILALKIDGFPDSFDPGYVVKACVSSLTATGMVIGMSFVTYRIHMRYGDSIDEFVKRVWSHGIPPPNATQTEKRDKRGSNAKGPSSGYASRLTRVEQHARNRFSRKGAVPDDVERGQESNKAKSL